VTKLFFVNHVSDVRPDLYEINVGNIDTLAKLTGLEKSELADGMPRSCCVTYHPETRYIAPYFLFERDTSAHVVERAIFEQFAIEAEPEVQVDYARRSALPRPSPEVIAAQAREYEAIEAEANIGAPASDIGQSMQRRREPGPELPYEVGTLPGVEPLATTPVRRFAFRPSPAVARELPQQAYTAADTVNLEKPHTR
jgi:hypothetical protein